LAANDEVSGTETPSTVDTAAPSFAALLSDDPEFSEDTESSETQPTQQSPASESDEAEAEPEQADAEDESAETDDESEESEEAPAIQLDPSAKVRVTIDGQEVEVTLDEALKGYSRQADYTRKTQELANQRKAQEAEFQAVRGERAKYAELMTQLEQALNEATGPEPDWARLQQESPEQFPLVWAQWQQRQSEIQAVAAERQRAQEAVQRDHAVQRQSYMEAEQSRLLDAIPEWKDAAKSKAEKAELVAYAEKTGFTREELAQVVDHRAIVMLRKAMLYDKAQAAKPALVKRIEKVKAATPGPTPQAKKPVSETTRARQRLAKTGRVEDAAEAFANMLDDSL
jgi:hypothetical protein